MEVSTELAPQAVVCVRHDCSESEGLLKVDKGHKQYVLCPDCARRWSE